MDDMKNGIDYRELTIRKFGDGTQRIIVDDVMISGNAIIVFDTHRFTIRDGILAYVEHIDVLEQVTEPLNE